MQQNRQEHLQEPQTVLNQPDPDLSMQHQHETPISASSAALSQLNGVTSSEESDLKALPDSATNRIEDYLDHVCAPLVAQVPFATRREWRGEMQTHLESLTLAHIELGESPAVAVEHAIAQFGTSQMVSRQWQQEWEQTGQSHAVAPSLQVARQWYGGALGLTAVLLIVSGDILNHGVRSDLVVGLLFLLTPLAVGVGIGRSAKHPVKATLNALKLLVLPLVLTYVAVYTYLRGMGGLADWHGIPAGLHAFKECLRNGLGNGIDVGAKIALIQMLCWTMISVPAAAVTRWTHHTLLPRLRRSLVR